MVKTTLYFNLIAFCVQLPSFSTICRRTRTLKTNFVLNAIWLSATVGTTPPISWRRWGEKLKGLSFKDHLTFRQMPDSTRSENVIWISNHIAIEDIHWVWVPTTTRFGKLALKESLRLNPVSVGTGRILPVDAEFGGYEVPKGTVLVTQNQVDVHQTHKTSCDSQI